MSYGVQWPKLLLNPLIPWPSLIIQESPLEKLKGGKKSNKTNARAGKFILFVRNAVLDDPTGCELLLGYIDLKYLSGLIFKSVLDCWQVYRIMGLIGCLYFTGYKWNLWL